jgi:hypothetical protein
MSKPTKEDAYRKADELALEICGTIHGVPGEMECELAAEVRHAICTTKMLLSPDVKRDDVIDAACGSSARLECLLILAQDLGFFREANLAGPRPGEGAQETEFQAAGFRLLAGLWM